MRVTGKLSHARKKKEKVGAHTMRFALAFAALLAVSSAARAQWTIVQLPERVFVAVPFMIDVSLDCPPPGEAPPPRGCNGTTLAWFEVSDHSAGAPVGMVTLFPFDTARAGPFTFHKPGRQLISILTEDTEFIGLIDLIGQAAFLVQHPAGPVTRK